MAGLFTALDWTAWSRLTVHTAMRADAFQSARWSYTSVAEGVRAVPSHTTARISPTLAIAYAMHPGWTARASAYSGANAPTHASLSPVNTFGFDPVAVGAEGIVGGEVGLDVVRGSLAAQVNLFQQNVRNGLASDAGDFLRSGVLVNAEKRRSRGVETSMEWQTLPSLAIRISYTFLSSRIIANDIDGASVEIPPRVGSRDPMVPIHALSGVVRGRLPLGAQALLRGRYLQGYSRLPEFGFDQPAPAVVFDASLALPLTDTFELWIRGENVLNRRYVNSDFLFSNSPAGAPSLLTVGVRLTSGK